MIRRSRSTWAEQENQSRHLRGRCGAAKGAGEGAHVCCHRAKSKTSGRLWQTAIPSTMHFACKVLSLKAGEVDSRCQNGLELRASEQCSRIILRRRMHKSSVNAPIIHCEGHSRA